MAPMHRRSWFVAGLLAALTDVDLAPPAQAPLIYASRVGGPGGVAVWDNVANTVTDVFSGAAVDSLVFDTSGRIIYTAINDNYIGRYDPMTHTNMPIVTGVGSLADLTLEPGGNTVLASRYGSGQLLRVDLTTNTIVNTFSYGRRVDGTANGPGGTLYVNLGMSNVAQIDPVTGAVLRQSANLNSLDGLAYDPFTGHLWAGSLSGGIYEVDPITLANLRFISAGVGVDGIAADGLGNIFMAGEDQHIYRYDIINNRVTQGASVPFLDDVAPLSGSGAEPAPEPSTLAIAGLSALSLLGYGWRRRRSARRMR